MFVTRGIGIDLVRVRRIGRLSDRWGERFLSRIYTPEELRYCLSRRNTSQHLAGRFAVKESVFKAVGHKLPWKSVNVGSGEEGAPCVSFGKRLAPDLTQENNRVLVSISHTSEYAVGMAVYQVREGQ